GGKHQVQLGRSAIVLALLEVDQRDLDSRLFGIVLDLLERMVLEESLVELSVPDVEPAEPLSDERAARILREDLLVDLDRLWVVLAELVERGEIHEDELGLRIPRERLTEVVLGAIELTGRSVHAAEVVITQHRAR